MATDVRKHTAPAAGETPRRQVINDLSLTINDIVPVANPTERAQLVASLTALGMAPSTSRPLYVHRADAAAGRRLEVTDDAGTTWRSVNTLDDTGWQAATLQNGWTAFGAPHQTPQYRRLNGVVYIQGQIKGGTIAPGTVIFTLPVGFRPLAYIVPAVWGNGAGNGLEIAPNGNVVVGDINAFTLRQSITMAPFPADQ